MRLQNENDALARFHEVCFAWERMERPKVPLKQVSSHECRVPVLPHYPPLLGFSGSKESANPLTKNTNVDLHWYPRTRNHPVKVTLCTQAFRGCRVGTNGSLCCFMQLLTSVPRLHRRMPRRSHRYLPRASHEWRYTSSGTMNS